jgi:Tfp pilus assembly protein PilP
MNRKGTPPPTLARRISVLALLLVAVVWTAVAQQGSPPAAPGKPAAAAPRTGQAGQARKSAKGASPATPAMPAAPGSPAAPGTAAPDLGKIEQILEGDEDVLAGNGFTYDPGNRRDPFKSLLAAQERPEFRGPMPEGIPGLLIDEIDLKGIFRTAKGYVAQVNSANQKKSFLLKEGDQLYDGDVVSIGRNEVTFKQIVQDPTALKPFRKVTKSLIPQ